MNLRGLAFSGLLFCCACSEPPLLDVRTAGTLPPGVAARVGSEAVSIDTVVRVTERQAVSPQTALALAVSDALLAQGARVTLAAGTTQHLERGAAARSLLEQLQSDAVKLGPPRAQELRDIVRERWTELDRPEAVRTTHAVVLNAKQERDVAARALAVRLALTLNSATTAEALIQATQAFPAEGFEVRAEALPFVTADGRVLRRRESGFVAEPSSFDQDFARAANQLERVGQLSPVTKSSFGYHIIRLEERAPGHSISPDELPGLLGAEAISRRAGRARRELLDKLRPATAIQIDRAVDDLTSQIKVSP